MTLTLRSIAKTYSGGTRAPLIFSWPRFVEDGGAIRSQFIDVVDLGPTVLDAAGTKFPSSVGGVKQIPVAGRSFLSTVRDTKAPGRQTQYFELRGNRAITDGRWRAVAMNQCGQPFEQDPWQLYDLEADFSESADVASKYPAELARLKKLWQSEWQRHNPGLIHATLPFLCERPAMFDHD